MREHNRSNHPNQCFRGVTFESRRLAGLMRFDGSRAASWLGQFQRGCEHWARRGIAHHHDPARARQGDGGTGVLRDVSIVDEDELTIWRTFNLELPDGSLKVRTSAATGRRSSITASDSRRASRTG